MMIKLKPTVEILDEVIYILLIPQYQGGYQNLLLHDLESFLENAHGIKDLGIQSPFHFLVEEQQFVVGLKRNPNDREFCAVKILFKSFYDKDNQQKFDVLYSLKNKYRMEMYDGKSHENLAITHHELEEHVKQMQQAKKEQFIPNNAPAYLLN